MVLRRDPLADPGPIPWPLVTANRCSLWAPIPVGEDEDGNQVTVTLPERKHHLGHKSASITLDRYGHLFPEELTTWPTASIGCTPRLVCTQRVPTPRWPPSGKAKGLVGDQALLVEVGRLELPDAFRLGLRA
jgi:hypothetical protein